jgi:HSP20 family protein
MNRSLTRQQSKDLNPWSVFQNDLWDVFDRFSKEFDMPSLATGNDFAPMIEVKDTGKAYQICAEVPGMDEKDINVTLKDNHLIIEGEKKNEVKNEDKKKGIFHSEFSYGRFYRAVPLSDEVDTEKVNASYKNGILSVELEKLPEKSGKHKKIQINAGKTGSPQVENKH